MFFALRVLYPLNYHSSIKTKSKLSNLSLSSLCSLPPLFIPSLVPSFLPIFLPSFLPPFVSLSLPSSFSPIHPDQRRYQNMKCFSLGRAITRYFKFSFFFVFFSLPLFSNNSQFCCYFYDTSPTTIC